MFISFLSGGRDKREGRAVMRGPERRDLYRIIVLSFG